MTSPARRSVSIAFTVTAALAVLGATGPAAAQSNTGTVQQRIFINPPSNFLTPSPSTDALIRPDGSIIAPSDINGRVPAPQAAPKPKQPPGESGILRSAPPSVAVDADGHGAIVSGAHIQ
jgi:hypothetical protein